MLVSKADSVLHFFHVFLCKTKVGNKNQHILPVVCMWKHVIHHTCVCQEFVSTG